MKFSFYCFVSLLSLLFVLVVPLVSALSVVDVAPRGFVYQETEVSYEAAQESLDSIVLIIDEMEALNFTVRYLNDAYAEAEQAFLAQDFRTPIVIGQLALYIRDTAYLGRDQLELFDQELSRAAEQSIDVTNAQALHHDARAALDEERYDAMLSLLEQSQRMLDESRTDHNRLMLIEKVQQNFFVRNKWILVAFFVVVIVGCYPLFSGVRHALIRRRLHRLRIDFDETQQLLKRLQHRCFIEKKMTTTAYKLKSVYYEEHLAELRHVIPVLESQLTGRIVHRKGVIEVQSGTPLAPRKGKKF